MQVRSPNRDPRILAWEIPRTEEPGGQQLMMCQKSRTRPSDRTASLAELTQFSLVTRTSKICCLSDFHTHSPGSFHIITMLHVMSPGFIHLITGRLYLFTPFIHPPPTSTPLKCLFLAHTKSTPGSICSRCLSGLCVNLVSSPSLKSGVLCCGVRGKKL